jgi:hypothetical protein
MSSAHCWSLADCWTLPVNLDTFCFLEAGTVRLGNPACWILVTSLSWDVSSLFLLNCAILREPCEIFFLMRVIQSGETQADLTLLKIVKPILTPAQPECSVPNSAQGLRACAAGWARGLNIGIQPQVVPDKEPPADKPFLGKLSCDNSLQVGTKIPAGDLPISLWNRVDLRHCHQ